MFDKAVDHIMMAFLPAFRQYLEHKSGKAGGHTSVPHHSRHNLGTIPGV